MRMKHCRRLIHSQNKSQSAGPEPRRACGKANEMKLKN